MAFRSSIFCKPCILHLLSIYIFINISHKTMIICHPSRPPQTSIFWCDYMLVFVAHMQGRYFCPLYHRTVTIFSGSFIFLLLLFLLQLCNCRRYCFFYSRIKWIRNNVICPQFTFIDQVRNRMCCRCVHRIIDIFLHVHPVHRGRFPGMPVRY